MATGVRVLERLEKRLMSVRLMVLLAVLTLRGELTWFGSTEASGGGEGLDGSSRNVI